MGSGFKDFAAGDVLTAADVDGYLMRQTVMTFADASARDTALSGVLDEGMIAYLENTNRTTYYDGSAWQDIATSSSIGTWTTFTPSWSNFTPGNATESWAYSTINKLMFIHGTTILGSTSSMGTAPSFTLPGGNATSGESVGSSTLFEDGVGYYTSVCRAFSSVVAIYSAYTGGTWGTQGNITATAPFTWGTGDEITLSIVVRIA